MERRKKIRNMVMALTLALFLLPAISAYAQGNGERGKGMRGQGRGGGGFDRKMGRMAEHLNLNPQQQSLFDNMRSTSRNYIEIQRSSRRALRSAFKEQLSQENPDFEAAAKEVKAEYGDKLKVSYEKMVDAGVTFYNSLSAEQRRNMVEMREKRGERARHRKGTRGGGGQGYGRGGY